MKRALVRWKKQDAISAIKQSRPIYRSPEFDVRVLPKTAEIARVLVVTPRKSGNAAERNLFRRRIKALFHEQSLYLGKFDWIFFAKPGISLLSYPQLHTICTKIESTSLEKR